jgi:hypothetical protein
MAKMPEKGEIGKIFPPLPKFFVLSRKKGEKNRLTSEEIRRSKVVAGVGFEPTTFRL